MAKLSYTIGKSDAGGAVSDTLCPFGMVTPKFAIKIMVGGGACTRCQHFIRKNISQQEVICAKVQD